MRRQFLSNIFFVVLVNLLIKPVWIFLIDRPVQNHLGATTYGSYMALFNTALIFSIIMDFGLTSYFTKRITQAKEDLPKLFPSFFGARLVLMLLYALVVGLFAWLLGYRGNELWLLGGVVLIQALNATVLFLRSGISSLHRFKVDGLLAVSDKLLMIVICGSMLLIPSWKAAFSLPRFVAAQQMSYAITVVFALYLLSKYARVALGFKLSKTMMVAVLKSSFPYALLVLLMSIYMRSDMLLIERLLPEGKHEAGMYYAGFRLLDAANILGISIAGVLMPMFGKMLAEQKSVAPLLLWSSMLMLPISLLAAVVSFYYGQEIMQMLMHDTNQHSGTVLALLMCTFPAYCIMYIYSTLLTAQAALKKLIAFASVAVLISLGFNLALIPTQGAVGAAVSALITQWAIATLCLVACIRLFSLNINYSAVAKILAYGILLAGAGYACKHLWNSWLIGAGVLLAMGMVLYVLLGFVSMGSWQQLILKQKQ